MNLDRCKATEHDDHFLVDTGDGRAPLRIAKSAVGKALQAKLRGMCGGGVVKMFEGGEALQSRPAPMMSVSPDEVSSSEPPESSVPAPTPGPVTLRDKLVDLGIAAPAPGGYQGSGGSMRDKLDALGITNPDRPAMLSLLNTEGAPPQVSPQSSASVAEPAAAAAPSATTPAALTAAPLSLQSLAGAQLAPKATVAVPNFTVPKLKEGEVPADLDAALKAKVAAAEALGKVEAEQKAAEATVQNDYAQRRETLAQESETRLKDLQSKADTLRDQVLKSEIDPQRLMGSMQTGQKVSAVIGMLLGGIGAGLTRGPNYAVETLNKAIDQDIEAQRSKKQSLMAMYQQAGHDLDVARDLARADLKDVAAAQLARASAQYGSAKQVQQTASIVAGLQADASEARRNAMTRDFEAKNRPLLAQQELERNAVAIAQGKQDMQLKAAAFNETTKGTMAAQAAKRVEAALNGGAAVRPDVLPLIGKETRERLVQRPDGTFEAAIDTDSAKKMREVNESAREMQTALAEMRSLRAQHSGGRALPGAVADRAEQLSEQMKIALNKMSRLGALDKGTQEVLDKIIPNPLAFFKTDAQVAARLDGLQRTVDTGVAAARGQFMLAPSAPTLTPRKPGG